MRTLVTGADGMLARSTLPLLDPRYTVGCDLPDCDITDLASLRRHSLAFHPGRILHFAAYTDVDGAEAQADRAFAVNAIGSENVARVATETRAQLVLVSTDYVYDGSVARPLLESDPVGPLSVYGKSKLEGEQRALAVCPDALVVRTAWLFGPGGKNFVDTIATRLVAGEAVQVVGDQVGRPTYTADLAAGILELADSVRSGLFHLTNEGDPASWFDVARYVAERVGANADLVSPTTTEALGRSAPRPAYSVLDCGKAQQAGVKALPGWRDAVTRHLGVA